MWFVVLLRYQPLRRLILATPRSLSVPVGLLTAAWLLAHVTDQRTRFFPVVSVYMYGDHTPTPSMTGVAVQGAWCDGRRERLNLRFMGRARVISRMHTLYGGLAYRRTAADSAARWDLIDRTLISIGRMYNRTFPDQPLCSIGLDELFLRADEYESGRLPSARVVRDVPLR